MPGLHTAAEIPDKTANEVVNGKVDLQDQLDTGELITGTPTATEVTSSDLTIDNVAFNTASMTVKKRTVAIGKGVKFRIQGGTAKTQYTIMVTATTDSTPAQTLKRFVRFNCIDEDGTG
jgi:hypothetical protein